MRDSLAKRLAKCRKMAQVSARDLSILAGLGSEGHVQLIESQRRTNIEADTASKLALVLGADMQWLTTGLGHPPTEDQVRNAVATARRRAAPADSGPSVKDTVARRRHKATGTHD